MVDMSEAIPVLDEAELNALHAEADSFEPDNSDGMGGTMNLDDEPKAQGVDKPTGEIILPIISVMSAVAAPNWEISDEENTVLADAFGDLLDKYFPDAPSYLGVEITALLAVGMVVAPRIAEGKPLRHKIEPKDNDIVVPQNEQMQGGDSETDLDVLAMTDKAGETIH